MGQLFPFCGKEVPPRTGATLIDHHEIKERPKPIKAQTNSAAQAKQLSYTPFGDSQRRILNHILLAPHKPLPAELNKNIPRRNLILSLGPLGKQ